VSGDLEDLLVVSGKHAGGGAMLCAHIGGCWLKPLVLEVASLLALVRLDDDRWLCAGRGRDGRGFAAIDWPLRWETSFLSVVPSRTWAGSAGALWVSVGDDRWVPAWRDPSWTAPFVGVYADVGQVIAMTADGGVIESRLMPSEIHAATMKHMSGAPPAATRRSGRA
jgi:eukaryotic-like serine/threonine-protein kinase